MPKDSQQKQFKYLSGNYTEVLKALHYPEEFEENQLVEQDLDEYLDVIGNDIHRTPLFNEKSTREEHRNILNTPPASGPYSYSQGDFEGRVFNLSDFYSALFSSDWCLGQAYFWLDYIGKSSKNFFVSYLDDNNLPCGVSLTIYKNTYDTPNQFYLKLCIIKNIIAPRDEREVTFISEPLLLSTECQNEANNIDESDIPGLIQQKLNCKTLYKLIERGLQTNQSSIDYLEELGNLRTSFKNYLADIPTMKKIHRKKWDNDFAPFEDQLDIIQQKAKELLPKHLGDANAAFELHSELTRSYNKFKVDLDREKFSESCGTAINHARETLKKHRGWKQIFANIGIALATAGVGYLVAGLINLAVTRGKHFYFRFNTDSVDKLEATQNEIDKLITPKKNP